MNSNREGAGVRSARKYALHTSSPLAKDSTNMVSHVRPSTRGGSGMGGKKDSFSTSNHIHGLGSEAKEAMLRGGLKVKRTHSLRMVATKGNATLTAMFHNFPTPDLDLFRKLYQRLEPEFAEQIPSAVCPFQFVTNESNEIVPRWQRSKSVDSIFETEDEEQDQEDDKMNDWLKDMRIKVHSRLAQKHQIANTANPTEPPQTGQEKLKEESAKRPLSPKTSPDSKKKDKIKMELNLDTIEPPSSSPRSHSARTFAKPRLSPKSSSRVAPAPLSSSSSSSPPTSPSKKSKQEKRLPPIQPRAGLPTSASASPLTPLSPSTSASKPRLPKIASQDMVDVDAGGPLFYPRNDPIYARRTYSELDVRRVRAKARNSIGLEPAS